MREIITLQCGTYANYVGAHFWNTQLGYLTYHEHEIDGTIYLRRTGEHQRKETVTPRVVLIDSKDAFGTLSAATCDSELSSWDGALETYHLGGATPSRKNGDREWTHWRDYMYMPLHHHSLGGVSRTDMSVDSYAAGHQAFQDHGWGQDLLENQVRFFVEECDTLQGFQLLVDTASGCSGMAGALAPELMDLLGSKVSIFAHSFSSAPNANLTRLTHALTELKSETHRVLHNVFEGTVAPTFTETYMHSATTNLALESIMGGFHVRKAGMDLVDVMEFMNPMGLTQALLCTPLLDAATWSSCSSGVLSIGPRPAATLFMHRPPLDPSVLPKFPVSEYRSECLPLPVPCPYVDPFLEAYAEVGQAVALSTSLHFRSQLKEWAAADLGHDPDAREALLQMIPSYEEIV